MPANIGGNNGSFCSEAAAGGEVWSVGGLELKLSQPVVTDTVTYLAAEPCFQPFYQDSLSSETTALDSFAGQTVSYTLTVDNSGHLADTYTVTITSTWPTAFPSPIGPLAPGETGSLPVAVQIPLGAANDAFDSATVKLTSQGDPMKTASVELTTTNAMWQRQFLPVIQHN